MKKRYLAGLMMAVIVLGNVATPLGSASVQAATAEMTITESEKIESQQSGTPTIVETGTCGANVTYTLDSEGTLTLSGSGHTTDYGLKESIFYNNTNIKKLVISEGVTGIGNYTFYGCSEISGELKLPSTISYIGESAFDDCTGFTGDLIIPEGVTKIGRRAFEDCTGFDGRLVLPESLREIDNCAFQQCKKLSGTLELPDGITSIEFAAFYDCKSLTGDLVIPEGITRVEDLAFCYCSGFDGELVLPDGINYIGDWAFRECSSLTGDLILPKGLKTLGGHAFAACESIEGRIVLPEGLETIGRNAFAMNMKVSGGLEIPSSLKTIGISAFEGCEGLSGELILPETLTSIGERSFVGPGFEKVTVLNKDMEIGYAALGYCYKGAYVAMDKFDLYGYADSTAESYGQLWGVNYHSMYTNAEGKYSYQKQTDGTAKITSCQSTATNINVPATMDERTVASIGEDAFADSKQLTTLALPATISVIDKSAFSQCVKLSDIEVASENINYSSIDGAICSKNGSRLIYCPPGKKEYIISEEITEIEEDAFADCTNTVIYCYADSRGKEILKERGVAYTVIIGENHVHNYTKTVEKEATCTESGSYHYTCPGCDHTYTEEAEATGHKHEQTKEVKATCTEDGYYEYTCGDCGDSYQEPIKATGHKHEQTKEVKATCTEDGYYEYTCGDCGDSYQESIKATGHKYEQTKKVKATCTTGGYIEETCKYCQDVKKTTSVALRHDYKETKTAATYTEKGYSTYCCNTCGHSYKDNYTNKKSLSKVNYKKAYTAKTTSIKLNWTRNKNADGYVIYQKINGAWKKIATIKANKTTGYTVKKLKAGTTYYFRIKAYCKEGTKTAYSPVSATKKVTTAPKKVSISKVSSPKSKSIKATWKKVSKASGYQMQICTNKKFNKNVISIVTKSTAKSRSKLKSKKTYYVRVRAYRTVDNVKVYGSWSTVKKVKCK